MLRISRALSVVLFCLAAGPSLSAEKETFTAFDSPSGSLFPFISLSLNSSGAIVGTYFDEFGGHGFLRTRDGAMISIDVPGAEGTTAAAINSAGTIAGAYFANGVSRGFLRDSSGVFTSFDFPAGGNCCTSLDGRLMSINPSGAVAGSYDVADEGGGSSIGRGFLRTPDGTFTSFDAPGAAFGTYVSGINPSGAITGTYFDEDGAERGFLRSPDGTFTAVDAPDAVFGTVVSSINPAGTITGFYTDASFQDHGFVRASDGSFATFDVPGANGTVPLSINPAGTITGIHFPAVQGFVRARDGTITAFAPPGGGFIKPESINTAGSIAGIYLDNSFVIHGFLLTK